MITSNINKLTLLKMIKNYKQIKHEIKLYHEAFYNLEEELIMQKEINALLKENNEKDETIKITESLKSTIEIEKEKITNTFYNFQIKMLQEKMNQMKQNFFTYRQQIENGIKFWFDKNIEEIESIIDEVTEDKIVKDKLMILLKRNKETFNIFKQGMTLSNENKKNDKKERNITPDREHY